MKKVHINMCPILDGHGVMTVLNSEQKVTITDNKRNKIINQHHT
jgi:ribosomal protein L24E